MEERARQLLLLAAVAGVGAAFGALSTAAVFSFLSRAKRREGYVRKLLESNGGAGGPHAERLLGAGSTGPGARLHDSSDLLSDEVVAEQLTRNIQFFGVESQKKVTESFVVVIGLGGVGSHAASMLLRSGVGRLLLVDFDQVSLSSLNRHAVATREDVGTPKAYCLKKHFSLIYPECQIEARVQLYDSSAEDEILSGQPDFVLDCIDNIDTKVSLLAACVRRGLRVLSAMGAGARADPTRIRVADLRESSNDPLSRAVRYRLKKDHGIEGGIPVVFSMEKPKAKLLPFQGSKEEETPSDYQIVPGFRVRIIPVLGTIPAIFGQVMASYVVTQLAQLDFQTEPIVNLDLDHYRVLHHRLLEHEELIYGSAEQVLSYAAVESESNLSQKVLHELHLGPWALYDLREVDLLVWTKGCWPKAKGTPGHTRPVGPSGGEATPFDSDPAVASDCFCDTVMLGMNLNVSPIGLVDAEEVMYIVKELWRGRSARDQNMDTGRKMWRSVNELMLVRWDKSKPAGVSNLILLKFSEADAHESTTLDQIKDEEPEFYAMVSRVLKRAETEFAL
ncbi:Uncharacterized protein C1A6.10 [Triticum urartu]|uniref:Uncharacterized protein C1A6.10 n=1 Tax=Triticum urartu TaxID=4572 RepID=M7YZP7_TRIUA|nr:Uncharacterized protein C1A6.10 [Triticum urartu]